MVNLILFCGSPGSGKTTLSKKITEEHNAIRFSFDEMGCLQHKELLPSIIEALNDGSNVVVDAVFSLTAWRKMVLEATQKFDCKRILILMDTPKDECIRRNSQRKNPLPEFIVESIYDSFEYPTLEEGWDEIRKVGPYGINFTSN